MLFAKVVDIECGHDNGRTIREHGLKVGDIIAVREIHMSASYTTIVDDGDNRFNSIHFEFFDDKSCTKPHDIYEDPLYNPFVKGGRYNG